MRLQSAVRLVIVVTVFASTIFSSVSRVAANDGPILIAEGSLTIGVKGAMTDGRYVAWIEGAESPATSCHRLHAVQISDPTNRWQTTIQRGQPYGIANGVIVWGSAVKECRQYTYDADPGIYGWNLTTGSQYTVTLDRIVDLTIGHGSVVWIAQDSPADPAWIRLRSYYGGKVFEIGRVTNGMQASALRFDGSQVSWLETTPDRLTTRIMSIRLGESPVVLHSATVIDWFDLFVNQLFWQSGNVLTTRNLVTGETLVIATDVRGAASTDGRYVVWERIEFPTQSTLLAYDLQTGSRFTIVSYATDDDATIGIAGTNISDAVIAWDRWSTSDYRTEIRAAAFHQLLPSGREPDPGTTGESWTYFPETSHYLAWGFRDFWERSGGLPVFGYPLTEEYIETNADTGTDYTVQFTERQRFEWHPENGGTPYQVLLGRLGYEQAADLGLLDEEPFRYRGDDEGPDAGCIYFPETGHYTCDDFVFYWRQHGLEMGDPGISYRESLALFGYALSEPFMTTNSDGDTVWTQYFERAVFELHPENVYPYRLLLRRLGAEDLAQRGW